MVFVFESVVAKSTNNVIGNNGALPWHIPEDLNRFKKLTLERSVIMGRRTWDEIYQRLGKPLPRRKNIVLTSRPLPNDVEVFSASSLEEAVSLAEGVPMIIGGAQLYTDTLSSAQTIHLTEVFGDYEGDAVFPELNMDEWDSQVEGETDKCRFITLTRRQPRPPRP